MGVIDLNASAITYRANSSTYENLYFACTAYQYQFPIDSDTAAQIKSFKPYAFYGSTAFVRLSFPNCEYVGSNAFYQGTVGGAYRVDVSLPRCKVIKENGFGNNYNVHNVYIPECIEIGSDAFYSNTTLYNLYAPKVETIGYHAFMSCPITSIDITNCKTIDTYGFYGIRVSDFLTDKYLPNIERMNSLAIWNTTYVNVVDLNPSNKAYIDYKAFYACGNISYIHLGKNVEMVHASNLTSIDTAFWFLSGLTTLSLDTFGTVPLIRSSNTNTAWPYNLSSVTFKNAVDYGFTSDNGITYTGSGFSGFSRLTYFSAPNLSRIGTYCFYSCTSLSYVDVRNTKYIASSAFWNCTKLKSITLLNCSSIGAYAFYNCTSLSSVVIKFPENSAYGSCIVGDRAFILTNVTNPLVRAFSSMGSYVFSNCQFLTNVDIHPEIKSLNGTFLNCMFLESARLNGVTLLSYSAFYNCFRLKTLYAPNLVSISSRSLSNCSALTELDLPNLTTWTESPPSNIEYIDCPKWNAHLQNGLSSLKKLRYINVGFTTANGDFKNLPSLEEVHLSKLTAALQGIAFQSCSALKIIDFGEGLSSIYSNQFTGCTALESIYLRRNGIVTLSYKSSAFNGTNSTFKIYVPSQWAASYRKHADWSWFPHSRWRCIDPIPEKEYLPDPDGPSEDGVSINNNIAEIDRLLGQL